MLASLGVTALAAVAVLMFTAGSVIANKRATRAADAALEHYKVETAGKVAEAHSAGLAAGERAGRAQSDVDKAKVEIAQANADAARLTKDAAEVNLKAEQLKIAVAWRVLAPDQRQRLTQALSHAPGAINLRYTDGDPEALFYAIQIAQAFSDAGWNVAPGSSKLANAIVFGISIPTASSAQAPEVQRAFNSAGISFDPSALPAAGAEFNVSRIDGATTVMIGSKRPQAF